MLTKLKGVIIVGVIILVFIGLYFSFNQDIGAITGQVIRDTPIYETWEEAVKRCDELCVPAMEIKEPKDRLKSEYCTTTFYVKENGIIRNIDGKNIKYYCDYHIGENLNIDEPYSTVREDCYLGKYKDNPETTSGNEGAIGVECGVAAPY